MMRKGKEITRVRQQFAAVVVTGLIYIMVGIQTWTYPPGYLGLGRLWAVVFVVAGWSALMTLVYRHVWLAVVSGGLLVGSALFRSAAIYVELGWQRWLRSFHTFDEPPLSSSFSIAGMTWFLIAMLLWIGWPQIQAGLLGIQWEDTDGK